MGDSVCIKGSDEGELIFDIVHDDDERGSHEDAVGSVVGFFFLGGEFFDKAYHVVPDVADEGGDVGRESLRNGEERLFSDGGEGIEGFLCFFDEVVGLSDGISVDEGLVVATSPYEVGVGTDEGVTSLRFSAFDGFEEKIPVVGLSMCQFEVN